MQKHLFNFNFFYFILLASMGQAGDNHGCSFTWWANATLHEIKSWASSSPRALEKCGPYGQLERFFWPIHSAAAGSTSEALSLLINAGAVLNAPDSLGMTPMHYAAENPRSDVLKTLINAGTDINLRDKNTSAS